MHMYTIPCDVHLQYSSGSSCSEGQVFSCFIFSSPRYFVKICQAVHDKSPPQRQQRNSQHHTHTHTYTHTPTLFFLFCRKHKRETSKNKKEESRRKETCICLKELLRFNNWKCGGEKVMFYLPTLFYLFIFALCYNLYL